MAGDAAMSLESGIVLLSLGYALLATLILAIVARARLPWPLKAGTIVLTSAFYVVVFLRTEGLLGWSAYASVPARFQLLWARTVEPNLAAQEPGAIHLWVEELDDSNLPSGVPRAYRLPYSARVAQKVEAARVEIMSGHPQGGRAIDFGGRDGATEAPAATAASGGAEPGGDPSSGGYLDPAFLGDDSKSVEFAPLPVPKLPDKGPP
jgi:hypothetical protein